MAPKGGNIVNPAAEKMLARGIELERAMHRNRVDNERLHMAMRQRFLDTLESEGVSDMERMVILGRMGGLADQLAMGMGAELALGNVN